MTKITISDHISEHTAGIDGQLKEKGASFVAFSVAHIAQLAIFIRGADASLTVTEEFVQLVPMTGMIEAEDIFCLLVATFDNVEVDWARAVSVATDDASSLTGKKLGVVTKLKMKVHSANGGIDFWRFHCIIHKESVCRKSLKIDHVMEVVVKTVNLSCVKGLKHRHLDNLLNDVSVSHGLPYHIEARWVNRDIALKRFFNSEGKL